MVRAASTVRLAMPVSTAPGPSSTKSVTPSASSVSRQCFQRTGLLSCADNNETPLGAVIVGECIDVRHDRHLRVAWVRLGDRLAQPVASRRHERSVERTGHRQGHHLLGADLLGDRARRGNALRRAGDDDLARGIEVGDPHVGVGPAARDLDEVVVEPQHRGHRAGVVVTGLVHRVGTLADQPHAVVEGKCARGGEGGVLAQAVAGAEARLDTQPLDRVEDDQARHERRQLGVAGVLQLVGVGIEQQPTDVAIGDLRCLVDQLPALVVDPGSSHARPL